MKSTDEINERKSIIADIIAKNGPLLLKDLHPHMNVSRPTVSSYLKDLVEVGCLRTIPVDEDMRKENDLREGAGPLYAINEENLEECDYISSRESQNIRQEKNRIRRHMVEKELVENPSTDKIKDFLREFLPGGKFEDSDEIEIKQSEISSEGLSLREYQEFYELWFKVMASDPDWNIDVQMSISPDNSDDDHPDIFLFETLDELKDLLK